VDNLKAVKAFAAAAGADSLDNSYYCFEATVDKKDPTEVRRLVEEAQLEMRRLSQQLPKD